MPVDQKTAVAFLAVAALAAGAVLSHVILKANRTVSAQTIIYPTPRPLPDFCLTDHEGNAFCDDQLAGHWTLMFFGFTQCPDICPMTLSTLANILRSSDDDGIKSQPGVVLVSVDPMRDTPEQLSTYLNYFDPRFKGITGDLTEIQKLAAALGVGYRYAAGDKEGDYTVEHTAALFLIGPDTAVRALFQPPHRAESLRRDIDLVLESK